MSIIALKRTRNRNHATGSWGWGAGGGDVCTPPSRGLRGLELELAARAAVGKPPHRTQGAVDVHYSFQSNVMCLHPSKTAA